MIELYPGPCDLCGARNYEPSFVHLCEPCAGRMVREHPERRLIVEGHSIRYVIPGDEPPMREPDPRDPDDICDIYEYAEHHGLPDPEDVALWQDALEKLHADKPWVFEDEHGHIFGPIEHLPVHVVPVALNGGADADGTENPFDESE